MSRAGTGRCAARRSWGSTTALLLPWATPFTGFDFRRALLGFQAVHGVRVVGADEGGRRHGRGRSFEVESEGVWLSGE